jgi:hypothetical protein
MACELGKRAEKDDKRSLEPMIQWLSGSPDVENKSIQYHHVEYPTRLVYYRRK